MYGLYWISMQTLRLKVMLCSFFDGLKKKELLIC